MNTQVMFSGNHADEAEGSIRLTPHWLLMRLRRDVLRGRIDCDPCTLPSNPTNAAHWIALPEDGKTAPWSGKRIFVNPPYGKKTNPSAWIERCVFYALENVGARVVLLVPARTDTRWFRQAVYAASDVMLLAGRLRFTCIPETKNSAPFPSMLVAYGCNFEGIRDLGIRIARRP